MSKHSEAPNTSMSSWLLLMHKLYHSTCVFLGCPLSCRMLSRSLKHSIIIPKMHLERWKDSSFDLGLDSCVCFVQKYTAEPISHALLHFSCSLHLHLELSAPPIVCWLSFLHDKSRFEYLRTITWNPAVRVAFHADLVPDDSGNGFPLRTANLNAGAIVGFGHLEILGFPIRQPGYPKAIVTDSKKIPTVKALNVSWLGKEWTKSHIVQRQYFIHSMIITMLLPPVPQNVTITNNRLQKTDFESVFHDSASTERF